MILIGLKKKLWYLEKKQWEHEIGLKNIKKLDQVNKHGGKT